MAEAAIYLPDELKPAATAANPFEGKVRTEADITAAVDQFQTQLEGVTDIADMGLEWGYRPLGAYDQKQVIADHRIREAETYAFGGETVQAEEWLPADKADALVASSEEKSGNGSRTVFEVVKKEGSDEEEVAVTSAGPLKRVVQKKMVTGMLPNLLEAAEKVDGGPEGPCRDAIVRELRERRDAYAREAERPVDDELAGEAEDIRTRIGALKEELNPYDARYSAAFGSEEVTDPDTDRTVEKPLGSRRDRAKLRVGQVFGLKNPTSKTRWGELTGDELKARRKHSAMGDAGVLTPMVGGKQAFEFTQPFTNAWKHKVIRGLNKRLGEVKGYVTEDHHDRADLMAHYMTVAIGKTWREGDAGPTVDALDRGSEDWDPAAAQELVSSFVRTDTFRDAVGDIGGDPEEHVGEEQQPPEDNTEQPQQQSEDADNQQQRTDEAANGNTEEEEDEPDEEVARILDDFLRFDTNGKEWLKNKEDPKNIRRVIDFVRKKRQEAADSGKDISSRQILRDLRLGETVGSEGKEDNTLSRILLAFMKDNPKGDIPF